MNRQHLLMKFSPRDNYKHIEICMYMNLYI